MYNIIALCGEAGTGKDTVLRSVLAAAPSLNEIVSSTSRPMRQGEAHGVNYYFYTPEEFGRKVIEGEMIECTIFNDWFYGTTYDALRSDGVINIGVFNPTGIESLLERPDCDVLVFRITTHDKIRMLRQLNREAKPNVKEIVRRFAADDKDFEYLDFDSFVLANDIENDIDANVKEILVQSGQYFARGQK